MKLSKQHKKSRGLHEKHFRGQQMSDIILGGQDGLVNVLGVVLGVASATNNSFIVLVAGLAATFAETISMAAVAYTSKKAERDYYNSERILEEKEVETVPDEEVDEIREIYRKKGFKGRLLEQVVKVITSNKKVWIDTMMTEELNLTQRFDKSPLSSGLLVFFATLFGSFVPIIPFALQPVSSAIISSLVLCLLVLFTIGAIKARLTVGNWIVSGTELAIIGTVAAATGYFIGLGLGKIFGTNVTAAG